MAKIHWACPECENQTSYKGLCRGCTEYDEQGTPVKPIYRVRLNHTPTEHHIHQRTKADFLNARRKNPSKKQLEEIKGIMNSQSKAIHHQHEHECDEGCEHGLEEEEDEFRPIGQGITEQVTKAIKDMEELGYAVVNDLGEEE